MVMSGTHDPVLVTLSIVIAVFSAYTAISLGARVRAARGQLQNWWLAAAALALGGGIWSMHFVAMLAYAMPGMAVGFDGPITLASLILVIACVGAGLAMVARPAPTRPRIVLAGALIGGGIVAMHYLGMRAMQMSAELSYDWRWVLVSIGIALGAATAAVALALREQRGWSQLAAASAMGAAIAGMHYAGMQAAIFTVPADHGAPVAAASDGQGYLAIAIGALTLLILMLALGAARIERLVARAALRESRSALRVTVADILRRRDAEDALEEVAALLGAHFGVSRTGMGDLDSSATLFDYRVCWTDGSVPVLVGRHPAAAFGPRIVAQLHAGATVAIADLLDSDLVTDAATRATARAVDTRAILVVPFLRAGQLRTIVYLNDREPRQWTADEIEFMEELAERIRFVIERTVAETELRELNAELERRVEARTRALQQAEDEKREVAALYRAYFENTPDSLFEIAVTEDGAFIVDQINAAHERGVGMKRSEVLGRRVDAVLPPRIAETVIAHYREVVASGTTAAFREVHKLRGTTQYWDTTLVPLTGPDGRVVKLIGASRNMTNQVVAEEALRQSQKIEAMGQLTGGVAHDFNNLLTPIMGALDRLNQKEVGDARDRRLIAGALQAAERARTLVHRLLSFARRQPLQAIPVNLSELATGMIDLIRSTAGPRVRVDLEIEPELPAALADPNQLELALLNLSVNARDAMPDGGVLRIAIDAATVADGDDRGVAPGRYVRMEVADTGIGMDAETRRRAVEPFFSTKGIGKGTGLGLSMAHGLAAQLGGALTIDSAPGAGTRIALWLPRSDAVAARIQTVAELTPRRQGERVLLVDDEEAVRDVTAQMLLDLGYAVTSVASASDALAVIHDGNWPDLLVTDHLMPAMTGTELARVARQLLPDLRILIISGYAEDAELNPELPLLAKPFSLPELASALARAG